LRRKIGIQAGCELNEKEDMGMAKNKGITGRTERYEEPRTITEKKTIREPRTVVETKTVEVPKTVMEEKTVEVPETIMETKFRERLLALSSKNLSGIDVVNDRGEELGEISDVMIDLETWKVAYVVLAFQKNFVSGKKLFAIPPEAFTIRHEGRKDRGDQEARHDLVLNIPQSAFKETDGFDKDDPPTQPDRDWLNGIYKRYGYPPYWGEQSGQRDTYPKSTRDVRENAHDIEEEARRNRQEAERRRDETNR
jgi:sporulation protein YlmC with PRC-barrel domain